jgi:hypothetical protein
MTRPRRSFGGNPPGRVAGAMLRALAAELSDPSRFTRAKAYARDDAVIDIVVEAGVVRAEVQGSRYDPYAVELHVGAIDEPGSVSLAELIPDRHEIGASCTCPDGGPLGVAYCKHVLATVLVLADEITIEPVLLSRWRSGRGREVEFEPVADDDVDDVDPIAPLLVAVGPLPAPPQLPPRLPVAMPAAAGDAAAVLADALGLLRGLSAGR